MNYQGVLFLLGRLLLALAVALLVPAGAAVYLGGDEARSLFLAAAIAAIVGVIVERTFRRGLEEPFGRREAFMLVALTWVMASVVGALPYVFTKGPAFVIDGLFESASGFTTTGASILDSVESEPPGLLLWRSLTQWLGGMGIIVLGIAILPKLAVGGMQLLGAEAPGPATEKLTPRIAQTAKALWGTYVLFTGLQTAVLIWLGMTPFEAVNHAFTTMATGGFSTNGASIGGYSSAIQVVVTLFMLIAGVNFVLHFNLLRGRPRTIVRDSEFRFYIGLVAVAVVLIAGNLYYSGAAAGVVDSLRLGAFQVAAIITTTGYATANFDAWPDFSRSLLFVLMFVGGCAGSTGGSVKVVRVLIVLKTLIVELKRFLQPRGVFPVRLGRRAIPDDVVGQVMTFFLLFLALFAAGGLMLALSGLDMVTAFSASATCLANVGPGFAEVGPAHTMSQLPGVTKLILIGLMITGRLELYTVLLALYLFRRRV